jgi:hypothetical protein
MSDRIVSIHRLRWTPFAVVVRAMRILESRFDRILATEPPSPERAAKLCHIEELRTALADSIGAC